MRRCARLGGVGSLAVWMLVALSAQPAAPLRPLLPIDAIGGILDAFRTHSVVGIDAGAESGDRRGNDFLLSLIRDPRFTAIVNDLMLEAYSGKYQDELDRFVRGEDVPHQALRRVWLDSTMVFPGTDEVPEIFLRGTRAQRDAAARAAAPCAGLGSTDRLGSGAHQRRLHEMARAA